MIDMHTHLLVGVDDGPKSIEDLIRFVEKAAKEGSTVKIVIPHAFSPQYHVSKDEVEGQIRLLKDIVREAGLSVTLHTEQEVLLHERLIQKTLEKKKKHNFVHILLENNKGILRDEPLIISEPEFPELKKWWYLV